MVISVKMRFITVCLDLGDDLKKQVIRYKVMANLYKFYDMTKF